MVSPPAPPLPVRKEDQPSCLRPAESPAPSPSPAPNGIEEVADELASLHDQQIDPLTEPQKSAVKYIERRLRDAVEGPDAEDD